MLDKILGGFKKKAENQHTGAEEVFKKKLAGIVYDEDIVKELAPIFAKLSQHDGFEKVMELIEAKESQIEKIVGGEWTTDHTDNDEDEVVDNQDKANDKDNKSLTADEILAQKYKQD